MQRGKINVACALDYEDTLQLLVFSQHLSIVCSNFNTIARINAHHYNNDKY